ncbi:MAG: arylesterase [Nitrospira sp.]|nr:arylesterase [Nitrospira sp.]
MSLIIPMLSWSCMIVSGCERPGEPPGQSTTVSATQQPISSTRSEALPRSNQPNTGFTQVEERPRIVALGDSLTAGLGVPAQESYPFRLQKLLDASGYHYQVVNAGVSGDTTAGGLSRLEWVLKNQPRIVILELGANDGLRGQPIKNIHENLRKILQRLKDADVKVLLTGMKIPPNYGLEYTTQFANVYTQLATEFDVPFLPFFLEDVAAHRSLNQADGIHPTGEGYGIIVQNVLRALKPLLKDTSHNIQSS